MAKPRIVLSESSRELVEMIKAGQLVELENWIKEGKSLRLPETDSGVSALSVSVKAGFHRLVEIVLQNEKWEAAELAKALDCALSNKRTDIVGLLLEAGAPVDQVRFDEACQTMDVRLVECLLEAGADPEKDNGFAQALNEHKAKPLLGIYRGLRERFPALDRQAALALSETVRARNLRWTSLLAWAGADPLVPVPYGMDEKWPDDIDYTTTAALGACMSDDVAFIRALRIKPNPEQLRELLAYACLRPRTEIIKYLPTLIPNAELNEPDTNSSKALEYLVKESKDRPWNWSGTQDNGKQTLESIELLLDRGARWNPADNDLSYTRRGLGTRDPKHVVQVVRLVLYTERATDPARVWELCRTPKIRDLIKKADTHLWTELLEFQPR